MTRPPASIRRMRRLAWGATALVLALATTVPLALDRPPRPAPRSAPARAFSAERAMDHVRAIAGAPRPVGSTRVAEVRGYLVRTLREMGLEPRVQVATAVRGWRAARSENVVTRIRGTGPSAPGSAILLSAHYDSVPMGPGAGDAGAAVAAVLETARALASGPPLARDVIVLLNCPEESFLQGATAFVEQDPWAPEVGFVVNMDPGGVSGPALMHGTSPGNGWLIRQVEAAVPELFATSLAATVKDLMGDRNDDFAIYRAAGWAGVDVAFIGGAGRYHSRLDRPEALDPGSLQNLGSYALGLARQLGSAASLDRRAPDAVYFDLVGSYLVAYPESWSLPLAVLALLLAVAAIGWARRAGELSFRGLLAGAGAQLAATALAVVTCFGAWRALAGTDRVTGAFLTGHQYRDGAFLLLFVALTVAAVSAVDTVCRRRLSLASAFLGAQLWWVVLALVTSARLPGTSYLFVWPVLATLAGTLGALVLRARQRPLLGAILLVVSGLPALVLAAPLVHTIAGALGTGDGPYLMALVSLVLGLELPALRLLAGWSGPVPRGAESERSPARWFLPAAAVLVAGLALASLLSFRFDARHPRTDFLVYGLDADTGQAVWATRSRASETIRPSHWTAPLLGASPVEGELRAFYPFSSARFLSAPAPALALAPPEAEVVAEEDGPDRRLLRLRVRSPRGAEVVEGVTAEPVLAWRIDGHPVSNLQVFAFHGVPPEGFELEVELPAGKDLELVLLDQSYGLPPGAGGKALPARPPGLMPEPSGGLVFTDATLVRRRLDL